MNVELNHCFQPFSSLKSSKNLMFLLDSLVFIAHLNKWGKGSRGIF